ncbi:hypothetical protein [Pallidibacillus thermolactis]|uniref:hypothetical protein n=1 Tax=Pallidibacillus thermolactis TaxID=251051 RepID=UPI0021DB1380|nr:hypothetical protein [Pallidibacillus thermolactis]MCU9601758.1 hypothetical protein [Pallidibacillus thermolactis subsp. kokeshiiformis]
MSKNNQNKQQPFRKRVEIVFGESDRDIWNWLNLQNEKKATLIKKILRSNMEGSLVEHDKIQQMIKEEVQKVMSKTLTSNLTATDNYENSVSENNSSQGKKTNNIFKGKVF